MTDTNLIKELARTICSAHIDGDRSKCPLCSDLADCDWEGTLPHARAAYTYLKGRIEKRLLEEMETPSDAVQRAGFSASRIRIKGDICPREDCGVGATTPGDKYLEIWQTMLEEFKREKMPQEDET